MGPGQHEEVSIALGLPVECHSTSGTADAGSEGSGGGVHLIVFVEESLMARVVQLDEAQNAVESATSSDGALVGGDRLGSESDAGEGIDEISVALGIRDGESGASGRF